MKTFLGLATGVLLGWAAGIASITTICRTSPRFMKFFAEECGYEYGSEKS